MAAAAMRILVMLRSPGRTPQVSRSCSGRASRSASLPLIQSSKAETVKMAVKRTALVANAVQNTPT